MDNFLRNPVVEYNTQRQPDGFGQYIDRHNLRKMCIICEKNSLLLLRSDTLPCIIYSIVF